VDKIQLSLYELSGYLLPGSVATLAIAVCYWAIWLPGVPFPVHEAHADVVGWAVIGGVAYLLGHCLQSVGNMVINGVEKAALSKGGVVPDPIIQRVQQRISSIVGVKADELDPVALFRLADEISVQNGAMTDREIFVAREGFYKGCAIAFAFLCVGLLARALFGAAGIKLTDYVYYISRTQLLLAAAGTAVAAGFFKRRARRFGAYRVSRAIYAFLAADSKRKE
jgi:hypothetical protein